MSPHPLWFLFWYSVLHGAAAMTLRYLNGTPLTEGDHLRLAVGLFPCAILTWIGFSKF